MVHARLSERFELLPIDPDKPTNNDDDGDGSGNGPEYPELRRHDEPSGSIGCIREEGSDTENGLWQISSINDGSEQAQASTQPIETKGRHLEDDCEY